MLDGVDLILTVLAPIVAQLIVDETTKKAYRELKKLIKDRLKGRPEADLVDREKPEDWEEKFKKALVEVSVDRDMEIIKQSQWLMAQVHPELAQRGEYNVRITGDFQGPLILVFHNDEQHTAPFLAPPRSHNGLIGRYDLLKNLKQELFASGQLVLRGLPGVGKTALAIELANDSEVLEHFPDGVLWVTLGREANVLSHLDEWGATLGIPPDKMGGSASTEMRAKDIHRAIGARRMLLVVDDAWETDVALTFWLGASHCAHLITTRSLEVAGEFANQRVVPELDENNGLMLLEQSIPELVQDKQDALRLVDAVGGLPLALVVAGKYLKKRTAVGQPLQEALDQLYNAKKWFHLYQIQPLGIKLSLQEIIKTSDEALDDASRCALRTLPVFPPKPNNFSKEAAVAVSAESEESLYTLADYGLLERNESGRYMLHQTIVDYAKAHFRDETAYRRMVEFFVSFVEAHKTDYGALEIETNNILAALKIAADQEMRRALVQGANAFYHFMEARGLYETAQLYLNQAQQAASSLNDPAGMAETLLHLGRLTEKRGNRKQAEKYYTEGIKLARKIKDRRLISDLLRNLGVLESKHRNLALAEKYYTEGIKLARKIKDRRLISDHLQGLGILEDKRGNFPQAEEHFREGIELAQEIDYKSRISGIYVSLGILESDRGDSVQAEKYYTEGVKLAQKIGNRTKISSFLVTMAFFELRHKNYMQAKEYALEGLELVFGMGYYERVVTFLKILTMLMHKGMSFFQAGEYLLDGLELAHKTLSPEEICILIENLGILELNSGSSQKAEKYLQKGLELANEIKNTERISSLLHNLGILELNSGSSQKAEKYLQKGLELTRKANYPWLTCCILNECGECYLNQGKCDLASEVFHESLEIARRLGLQESTATALYGLARVAAYHNNISEAYRQGQESLSIFEGMAHIRTDEVNRWLASLP